MNQVGVGDLKIEFSGSESELIQKMLDPQSQGGIKATQYQIADEGTRPAHKIDGGRFPIERRSGRKSRGPLNTHIQTNMESPNNSN